MRDTLLVFRRAVQPTLDHPSSLLADALMPVLYLVLFGPLLAKLAAAPGFPPGGAWAVFVPGVLVMLCMFGAMFAGFELLPDYRFGVVERMRVSPLSRPALLLGRVAYNTVRMLVQAVLLVLLAVLLFGLRVSPLGVVIGLLLLAVLAAAAAAVSYGLALKLKNEYLFAPLVQGVSMPLLLLSGAFIPIDVGPDWLRWLAQLNPLTHVLRAERALFLGEFTSAVAIGAGVLALVLGAGLWWGMRVFRRENA
ncbi:ABC transporter permease [Crossiella sp. CA-258035]|uniref:ABC transporter permease n=1 Tax=Crossiella sp. CA-258035 TaxID=2981138 RepID=UPI0024BC6CAA|nr:ABC transporter permease [Crossiella sp. CA-258035]WHT18774.1 ABC transporter permease [Crossiella sp. CA-258035]